MTAIREKLHAHIDALPEERLKALTPIVELISEDYWKPVVETDLTDEEIALIDEAMEERRRNPSSFITLDEFKQRIKDGTALQI